MNIAVNQVENKTEGLVAFTIADQVFKKLQKAIVEGDIPAGSKISKPVLAYKFGISRGPLREALSRLEACNLIERKPNIGSLSRILCNCRCLNEVL